MGLEMVEEILGGIMGHDSHEMTVYRGREYELESAGYTEDNYGA
jgi:hypothetical protein